MGKEGIMDVNPKPKFNKLAIWGFVLACVLACVVIINILNPYSDILSIIQFVTLPITYIFIVFGPILFILAVIFSIIALVQIKKKGERGKPMAIISLILLALLLLLVVAWIIWTVIAFTGHDPYKPNIETELGDASWCPKDLKIYQTYHTSQGYTVGTTGKVRNIDGVDYCQYINTKSGFGDKPTETWTSENESFQIIIEQVSSVKTDWEYCFYIDNQEINCNSSYYRGFFN